MTHFNLKLAGLTLCASLLGGCSILPDPAPADTIYRLSSLPPSVETASKAYVIRVDRPGGSTIFQTRDVIVSPDGQRLASAAQAKWVETIPTMIQSAFVEVLASNPNLVGVTPASGTRTDKRIQLTIKNFEAHFDNGPKSAPLAVVRYTVTYANSSNRALLGTYEIKKTHRARTASVSAIVNSISTANNEALNDVVNWLDVQAKAPKS